MGNSYWDDSNENNYPDCGDEYEFHNDNYKTRLNDKIREFFPNSESHILNFGNLEIEPDDKILQDFKKKIFKMHHAYEEVLFNINPSNLIIKSFIIELAQEVAGRVYLITDTDELVFLPIENYEILNSNKEILKVDNEYEEMMLDLLTFGELKENEEFCYGINESIVTNTFFCTKEIFDDKILIKRPSFKELKFDVIKLIKINGLKISANEKIDKNDVFLKKVFEGISYFGGRIIRLIMNNEKGVNFFLGVIVAGEVLKDVDDKIKLEMEFLNRLLKSVFPYIDITEVNEKELNDILEFIRTKEFFGTIVGHSTIPATNRVLRDLENAIMTEKWGVMTISESLSELSVESIIDDLNFEINSLIPKERHADPDGGLLRIYIESKLKEAKVSNNYLIELKKVFEYFQENKNYGLWNTCNYIFTDKELIYNTIYSIFKSNYKISKPFWFPIKIVKLNKLLSQFPKAFQLITVERLGYNISKEFKLLNTIYSSHKLGDFIHFPTKPLNNFAISSVPRFETELPETITDSMYKPLSIGKIKNNVIKNKSFYIDSDSLMRHCLVMGSTGSGKTNTIMNILFNLRKKDINIPFLIIEPIKKEFRHLLNDFDDLLIYTAGSKINPLKINLFEVPSFLTYAQWVNELLDIICASFYIWEPFRGLILNCLNDIYQINGWSEETRGRTPTMEEFVKFSKLKIECTSYNLHTRANHMGAFENRFESMIKGARGITFNSIESRPSIEEFLNKPVVIELDGLRNDNERAFVFNFLMRKLYLYQQKKGDSEHLRHLTVIEEAHRLLSSNFQGFDSQTRTISMKAQENFSDILAEIRTYGEGIIISEQKPHQLNDVAITNTNIKICHKLPSRNQIHNFKDSLGLLTEHLPFITQLKPGECIVASERIGTPFLVQVDLVKHKKWGIENMITDELIKEKVSFKKKIDQLHYCIGYDKHSKEKYLIIKELIFEDKNIERIIKYPKKKICYNFSNFRLKFWERIKDFYSTYDFCPECLEIIPKSSRNKCSTCNNNLQKIETLKLPQFNMYLQSDIILRNLKIDELYEKYKKLVPAEYSRDYQTHHGELKQEFDNSFGYLEIKNNYKDSMELSLF
ncbi:MAG: ATP-binding protein [Candidatus Lokiarchaeia archaeon]